MLDAVEELTKLKASLRQQAKDGQEPNLKDVNRLYELIEKTGMVEEIELEDDNGDSSQS
jgi:hypothetical protein